MLFPSWCSEIIQVSPYPGSRHSISYIKRVMMLWSLNSYQLDLIQNAQPSLYHFPIFLHSTKGPTFTRLLLSDFNTHMNIFCNFYHVEIYMLMSIWNSLAGSVAVEPLDVYKKLRWKFRWKFLPFIKERERERESYSRSLTACPKDISFTSTPKTLRNPNEAR